MNRVRIRPMMISTLETLGETSKVFNAKCLECRSPMDIHQPNSDDPALFLGVCSDCGRWYRIEAETAGDRILFLAVPTGSEVAPASPD